MVLMHPCGWLEVYQTPKSHNALIDSFKVWESPQVWGFFTFLINLAYCVASRQLVNTVQHIIISDQTHNILSRFFLSRSFSQNIKCKKWFLSYSPDPTTNFENRLTFFLYYQSLHFLLYLFFIRWIYTSWKFAKTKFWSRCGIRRTAYLCFVLIME